MPLRLLPESSLSLHTTDKLNRRPLQLLGHPWGGVDQRQVVPDLPGRQTVPSKQRRRKGGRSQGCLCR